VEAQKRETKEKESTLWICLLVSRPVECNQLQKRKWREVEIYRGELREGKKLEPKRNRIKQRERKSDNERDG